MEALSSAVAVLTAMITPAVLISACGALILSTSTRLGRVTDRVRLLIDRFEEMMRSQQDEGVEMFEERRAATFDQLDRLTTRSRLLQRSMTVFYLALGVFVATSVAIGLVAAVGTAVYSWVPEALEGLLDACRGCPLDCNAWDGGGSKTGAARPSTLMSCAGCAEVLSRAYEGSG